MLITGGVADVFELFFVVSNVIFVDKIDTPFLRISIVIVPVTPAVSHEAPQSVIIPAKSLSMALPTKTKTLQLVVLDKHISLYILVFLIDCCKAAGVTKLVSLVPVLTSVYAASKEQNRWNRDDRNCVWPSLLLSDV